MYVLSRYADVRAALSDAERFSSTQGVGYERRPVPMMIAYDPPAHTRLRRLVAGRFSPRALSLWQARIEAIASSLLDPLIGAGPIDLVASLASPFPVQVIAEMMDIPFERRADFRRWSDHTVEALSGAVHLTQAERERVEHAIWEISQYFVSVIKERAPRATASDDLISLLLRPNEDGERLRDLEVVSFCVLLLVAGNETTTHLISNTVAQLAEQPSDWQQLVRDPSLVRAALEESLRHQAPIQGFFRNTRQPIEVAGVTIPEGSKVMVLYGAANRDPRKFPEPDTFQLTRNPTDHLAFGFGPHTCLGAQLARIQTRVLFERMLSKVKRIELMAGQTRTANPLLRGFDTLPVTLQSR